MTKPILTKEEIRYLLGISRGINFILTDYCELTMNTKSHVWPEMVEMLKLKPTSTKKKIIKCVKKRAKNYYKQGD